MPPRPPRKILLKRWPSVIAPAKLLFREQREKVCVCGRTSFCLLGGIFLSFKSGRHERSDSRTLGFERQIGDRCFLSLCAAWEGRWKQKHMVANYMYFFYLKILIWLIVLAKFLRLYKFYYPNIDVVIIFFLFFYFFFRDNDIMKFLYFMIFLFFLPRCV